METWFIAALISAFAGGLGAFSIKIAAHRGYDSKTVVFVGSLFTFAIALPLALYFEGVDAITLEIFLFPFIAGLFVAVMAILKIVTLRYIDATIFFPLFKVVAPVLAIASGLLFFGESFGSSEWIGLVFSVLVPVMLISKHENTRQSNLLLGLLLIVLVSFLTVISTILQKFIADASNSVFWIYCFLQIGVLVGSAVVVLIKKERLKWSEVWDQSYLFYMLWRAAVISISVLCVIYAFAQSGPLAIVYTINSLYILIPIVLSIVYYGEHWNVRKVIAIILSVVAIAFLQ